MRKRIEECEQNKMEVISLRVDKELLKKVDTYWRLNLYRDRTALLVEMMETFLDTIKCPHCGAWNPKGSHLCAVCLRKLSDEDETMSKLLGLIDKHPELIAELTSKKEEV